MYKLKEETTLLFNMISSQLEVNGGKLSRDFIEDYANKCTFEYAKIGDSARVCVMTTTTGNKVVGHALVLDPNNDVEEIGNGVAKENCINELWSFLGGVAKMLERA